jgi:hypothetical protein
MTAQPLEKRIQQDVAKVRKELGILEGDIAARVGKIEKNLNKSTATISSKVENGVSQLSNGFGKFTKDATKTVRDTTKTAKKDVSTGLIRYNAKAKDFADKLPGGIGKKASRYPWAALSITLFVGLLLGTALKPARQPC